MLGLGSLWVPELVGISNPIVPVMANGLRRGKTIRQVPKAFSEIKSRGPGAEGIIAERFTAASADLPSETDGGNRLMFVIFKKLIEQVELSVVEPSLGRSGELLSGCYIHHRWSERCSETGGGRCPLKGRNP